MTFDLSRRAVLGGALGASLSAACASSRSTPPAAAARDVPAEPSAAAAAIAALEARIGGRVGFFALDTGSGAELAHRADERFALCSTFKALLAAAVLERVDRGEVALQQRIAYGEKDLLEYAPVTREKLAQGALSVEALLAASLIVSDNTAANLLFPLVGGPAGLTGFLRRHGDDVTRLDRDEPMLNTNLPGDARDTTSPRAMAGTLRTILLGDVLSAASRQRWLDWLAASTTGKARLRAGLPEDYVVGDKTGTGENGAVNDVALAWPAKRAPLIIVAYLSGSRLPLERLNAAHAELARIAAQRLSPPA